jgi:long-chain acyl-CoA synthetase
MFEYMTLGARLEQSAAAHSHKTFLYWKDEQVSFADFNCRMNQVAHGLRALGVMHGQKVALLLKNCPEFLYSFCACNKLGAVVVPINPLLKGEEVQYILDNSQSVALIAGAEFAPMVREIRANCPHLREVRFVGATPEGESAFDEFWHMPETAPDAQVSPDDIASIIYTSGTTGKPKGVLLSHANYDYDVWATIEGARYTESDRMLCMLPLFHVNAQVVSLLPALRQGASFILLEGFSARDFLPTVARYRATTFSSVPTIYAILNNRPEATEYDLSSLRVCICGAAPLPLEVYNEFERKFNAFMLEGYGLSEATCSVTLNPIDGRRKIGSIGVPLPGQQVKIFDDHDVEKPAGHVGEIVVRGSNVMQGYYGNPEATRATIRNGWLHTGDLGTIDDEGYLYIVGRKKEMIIRGGENIYPKEIEEVLYHHPAILEAAVVGLPHPIWGEEVVAVLVLREGQRVSEQDVIDYCKQHLADYKCPRQVRLVESFPKTATGKIQKRELVKTLHIKEQ